MDKTIAVNIPIPDIAMTDRVYSYGGQLRRTNRHTNIIFNLRTKA